MCGWKQELWYACGLMEVLRTHLVFWLSEPILHSLVSVKLSSFYWEILRRDKQVYRHSSVRRLLILGKWEHKKVSA